MVIDEALAARIISNVVARVTVDVLPQTPTLPAVVTHRISTPVRVSSMTGTSGLTAARYQLDIVAETAASREAISKLVRTAFHNYAGTMGGVSGVVVGRSSIEGERDTYNPTTQRYWKMIDLLIWHEET